LFVARRALLSAFPSVADSFTRILSDLHFGDRASRVARLSQIRPLLDAPHLILNGDTLDTRPGPDPQHTAACRAEILDFFGREAPSTTFLTGNHDADFSPHHSLDLAHGEVFVVHGDIFFDNIVPWSADVPLIERLIAQELRQASPAERERLEYRLAMFRRVSAAIPQRHQSEKHGLKYLARMLADLAWPPWRVLWIMRAWKRAPTNAAELTRRYRPDARFVVAGHTHRPGVWQMPDGLVVINTGSYCRPLGGTAVDLTESRVIVRAIDARSDEFRLGATLAEFPLARR
jgi:predicted phosphodiesterase